MKRFFLNLTLICALASPMFSQSAKTIKLTIAGSPTALQATATTVNASQGDILTWKATTSGLLFSIKFAATNPCDPGRSNLSQSPPICVVSAPSGNYAYTVGPPAANSAKVPTKRRWWQRSRLHIDTFVTQCRNCDIAVAGPPPTPAP